MSSWAVPGFAEERQLGSGASGRVVAAVHHASGTRVAIKYLSPRLLGDAGFLEAFRGEASLLRSLYAPQVVRLFEYVEVPGQGAAIVMELVDGVSLHEMITRQGPTSAESALAVLKGSLLGLAAAHAVGIVHRDYKPENVLVDRSGQSKLTDFGVAARTGQAAGGGTPLYMAPEQWEGAPAAPATDIYAATAVFFECLTGQPPFSGPIGDLAAQHATGAVPYQLVEEPLQELIARGMAKGPAYRPSDASRFLAELEATAATAYGGDWEDRGRSQLAARAAALLLLLLPHGEAAVDAAGTGTSTTSTTLTTTARTTAKAGRASSRVWVYTVVIAAVVGIAAGSLAAVALSRGHSGGSAGPASAGRPASAGPTASGHHSAASGAAAAASSPACGTPGVGAIAYVAQVPNGQVDTTDVDVRCGTAPPVILQQPDGAGSLTWSPDGTQLAWMENGAVVVAQVKATKWTLRSWSCQMCLGVEFLAEQAVAVSEPTQDDLGSTQLLDFPASGNGQPVARPVTGFPVIPADEVGDFQFDVLGVLSSGDMVVSVGTGGGSDEAPGQTFFRVSAAGQATQYPSTSASGSGTGSPFGMVGDPAINPAGTQLAFTTSARCYANQGTQADNLLNLATGAVTSPALPAGGGHYGYWINGMWFDSSGTLYVSLVPNISTCAAPGGPLWTAGATPTVYKLAGGQWVKAGNGTFEEAYGPGSWAATTSGALSAGTEELDSPMTMTISDGSSHATVPSVSDFTWAP